MTIDPKHFVWCRKHDVKVGSIVRQNGEDWLVRMIYFGQGETLKGMNLITGEEKYLYPTEDPDEVVKVYG